MSFTQFACSLRRIALLVIAGWILILFYLSGSLFVISSKEAKYTINDALMEQYGRAIQDLGVMRKQNEELKELLKEKERIEAGKPQLSFSSNVLRPQLHGASVSEKGTPKFSHEHEVARRALDNSIRELYFYLNDQFGKKEYPFAKHALGQLFSLLGQSAAFSDVDGAKEWRRASLSNVTYEIQSRISALQNPEDCSLARKLVCNINKGCGFGCQLHHVTYCFIVAYGTGRTLLLYRDGREWSYSSKGWTSAFLPVSKCSFEKIAEDGDRAVSWMGLKESASEKVLQMPIIDGLGSRPDLLPLAFPLEYADTFIKFHSNPPVFFIAQFMRYLMRPSNTMSERVEEAAAKVPFGKGPIVGLQIRRTDKVGTEASFHSLQEYIKWTEDWFRIEEHRTGKSVERKIFIATDDPSVFSEARKSYPNYTVYGDETVAKTAQLSSRYSDSSLTGVVIDIELLARCDYLVCTFSSQVCRLGYELMQIRLGDAGDNFHSLDDLYYYGGQQAHEQIVVEAYKAETDAEIDLEVGDVVGIAGNHWNGFSKGVNRRTGKSGLYPSYAVREKWIVVNFP